MIDSKLPVRLKMHAHFNGNFYHPRVYQPGELPLELLTEDLVVQEGRVSADVSGFSKKIGAFEDTEIKLSVEEPVNQPTTYDKPQVAVVKPKLSINKATITEITTAGIPMNAAKKIVELREKEKYRFFGKSSIAQE